MRLVDLIENYLSIWRGNFLVACVEKFFGNHLMEDLQKLNNIQVVIVIKVRWEKRDKAESLN